VTGCPSRARDEELLLAKISEAAGRQRLGRRRLTYPGVSGGTRHRTANCLVLLKIWCAGVVVVCAAAAVVCAVRGVGLAAVVAAALAVLSLGLLAFVQRAPAAARDRNARLDLYEHGHSGLSDGYLNWLWQPEVWSRKARQSAAFQGFAKRIGLLDYWKQNRWPDLCSPKPENGPEGFVCQ